ncbi:MAG: hypothetical protein NXY57DRAFT_989258 [Lentinula lateritia]|uniref:NmrA-like domain-containing protein n=1 Tax=Lentinula lateritia TaxID=40482 RepID=A0ABQ8VX48_9AGAR|nr:MAG: hypothetical protein NXY57DRAFT_989258 [Lentinula lateritia]KAJ4500938.1 hypothetical protein C8R41DRAFT_809522 [Lentinula lateritia]
MSKLTSFAIIGSGNIGSFIISAFLGQAAPPSTLIVLSRNPESKNFPPEVQVVKVDDYGDINAVARILTAHNIEAVISTVGFGGISAQKKMVDAANLAGVKLFAPSEFGSPTDGAPREYRPLQERDEVAEYINAIGLPWARFYTGAFINTALFTVTGVRVNGKINIIGSGHTPVTFTSEEDAGGFIAYVLTSLPSSSISNKIFRLEGDRASLQDIAKWYHKEVAYVEAIPGPRSEILSMFSRIFESGAASTGWNFALEGEGKGWDAAGSANELWQGHQWKKIRDLVTTL